MCIGMKDAIMDDSDLRIIIALLIFANAISMTIIHP